MPDHAAAEQALQNSGVPFTSLRNGFHAAFAPTLLGDAVESGELRAPEDGPISWTTHADLAEAAAIALTDETLDETELNLTGAEAVDLAGVAAIVSEIKGRPIKRVVVPDDEYRTGLVNMGLPEARVDILMGMFGASRRGDFARVEPTLERMIGRSPVPLHSVLTDALSS